MPSFSSLTAQKTRKIDIPDIPKDEKLKRLKVSIKQLQKDGIEEPLVDVNREGNWPSIPSGVMAFDYASGIGGFPRGRITEISGQESTGKSLIVAGAIAELQKTPNGVAAFVDVEEALDSQWMTLNGVNMDELLVAQPECAEDAYETCYSLMESGAVDLLMFDSTNAAIPRAELEGKSGDASMGIRARLLSQALMKIKTLAAKHNVAVVFISQMRKNFNMFGSNDTIGIGEAMKYYASMRIKITNVSGASGKIKIGNDEIGKYVKAKFFKNKLGKPFQEAQYAIYYDSGLDKIGSIADPAIEAGIITKAGAWFSYGEERIGQGKPAVVEWIKADPTRVDMIRDKMFNQPATVETTAEVEDTEVLEPDAIEVPVKKKRGSKP